MKSPLRYQISDYDCGPTSLLNAVSFLFEREDIPPELIRNTMLYCLDSYGEDGGAGRSGTSRAAMMFLTNWLGSFARAGKLNISCRYLSGKSVYLGSESYINDTLRRGGAVVVRLFYDEWHYVLLDGIEGGSVLMFDPYYRTEEYEEKGIRLDWAHPFTYNRVVPQELFNRTAEEMYALGPEDGREAVLLFNEKTKLVPEKTIEYFI